MYILIEGHANEALDKGHVWGYCPDCQVKDSMNDILFDDIFKGVALRHDDKDSLSSGKTAHGLATSSWLNQSVQPG